MKPVWAMLGAVVLIQVSYPFTDGGVRAATVIATVLIGAASSLAHAIHTRGRRAAAAWSATAVVGFAVEALGVRTGFPFGFYSYSDGLGPTVAGVPLVIPFAWAWMAWPAWLVATRLVAHRWARIGVGAVALATWDLFLDPQMVSAGYWSWAGGDIPLRNYVGWLAVSLVVMTVFATLVPPATADDRPMYALYLWTYASSVLAHAVFLGLPESALWGGLGMGLVAVPLAVRLWR